MHAINQLPPGTSNPHVNDRNPGGFPTQRMTGHGRSRHRARYTVQPSIQFRRTWPAPSLLSRYVSSSEKIPFHDEPFRESGTERSGAHKAHPHPSGVAEPSQADELIPHRLKDALSLIDVRVLDHLIVAGGDVTSMAERGLI